MRKQFLQGCPDSTTAWRLAPWASAIVKVDGGYQAFESAADYAIWVRSNSKE